MVHLLLLLLLCFPTDAFFAFGWLRRGPLFGPHPFAKTFFYVISGSQPFRYAEHFQWLLDLLEKNFDNLIWCIRWKMWLAISKKVVNPCSTHTHSTCAWRFVKQSMQRNVRSVECRCLNLWWPLPSNENCSLRPKSFFVLFCFASNLRKIIKISSFSNVDWLMRNTASQE